MTTCTSKLWYVKETVYMLKFSISDKNVMSVQLFKKDKDENYQCTKLIATEDKIIIETENMHSILRGVPQRTFCINELNTNQKEDILDSIDRRDIAIIESCIHPQLKIIIHAL